MNVSFLKNKVLRSVIVELFLFAGVIAGCFLLLNHISHTNWKDMLFFNSDMLTLALVGQSIQLGEPFHWVFSSQIFLFPEGLLYAALSLLTDNFKTVLILSGILNIALLYGLIRWLVSTLTDKRSYQRAFSIFYTFSVILIMLIESRNLDLFVGMFFFFTTVYYGVILASIAALATSFSLLKNLQNQETSTRRRLLVGISFSLALLTSTSNPMFFLQFTAAFSVAIAIVGLLKVIRWRSALYMALPFILAVPLSMIVRKLFFNDFLSPLGGLSNYLNFQSIGTAINEYIGILRLMLHGTVAQKLEVIVILGVMIVAIVVSTYIITSKVRRKNNALTAKLSESDSILILFATIAPLATLVGTILTGNAITRYLLPLVFFTPLLFIPLYHFVTKRGEAVGRIVILSLTSVVIIVALALQPLTTFKQLSQYYPSDATCLDTSLAGTPHVAGVAQYWRARALQLNSHDGHIVAQVSSGLTRFGWLYNNASYDVYDYSFVVVDKPQQTHNHEISSHPAFTITESTVLSKLGQPSKVYQCRTFDLYVYDVGTRGRAILNATVRDRSTGL